MATLKIDPIMRREEVAAATGLTSATLYRYAKVGKFPRPIQLTPHTIGWKTSVVQEWIDSRPVA